MSKNCLVTVVVVFVASMVLGYVVHGVLLGQHYLDFVGVFRPQEEANQYCAWMIVAHVLFSFGFVWVYDRGKEGKPWHIEGLRYGLAIAVLMTIPTYLIYYVVLPITMDLVLKQILFDTIAIVLLGLIVAKVKK